MGSGPPPPSPYPPQSLEALLQLRLPEELRDALSDGALQRRLAARLRPHPPPSAVSHPPLKKNPNPPPKTPFNPFFLPPPPQPKLNPTASESFLAACRRLEVRIWGGLLQY